MTERRKRSEVAGLRSQDSGMSMPTQEEREEDMVIIARERREADRKLIEERDRREREEQRVGERAFAEAAGETVEVTWGAELYQPLPYNGNTVGPFKVVARLLPGETVADALVRVHREVSGAARTIRAEKFKEYLEELGKFVRDANDVRV